MALCIKQRGQCCFRHDEDDNDNDDDKDNNKSRMTMATMSLSRTMMMMMMNNFDNDYYGMAMGDRKLARAAPSTQGNNQLLVIVGVEEKKEGDYCG